MLAVLGMQKSLVNILNAAKHLKSFCHEPWDYQELMILDGIRAKIALVTMQEVHGKALGIPCDIHMCRIFKILGWVPSFVEKETSICMDVVEKSTRKREEDKYNYK